MNTLNITCTEFVCVCALVLNMFQQQGLLNGCHNTRKEEVYIHGTEQRFIRENVSNKRNIIFCTQEFVRNYTNDWQFAKLKLFVFSALYICS